MNLSSFQKVLSGKKTYLGALLYAAWVVGNVVFGGSDWNYAVPQLWLVWSVMSGRAALAKLPFR